ncbi:hypothetical protein MFIFM68171_10724 [Madurella fahalii]|uniref:Guanine nucleotide-exchange factor SEC12 n=1 Tax=Madurella fahalii TaxID=1157608 RepID=A0ABQ0GS34_9PEZI
MAPAIPSAELRLSYPLYAVDFDPQNANRLLVGGGGGTAVAFRSGVGNKVTVLDASREESLQIVSELELSRDEDSVNTLAVGSRRKNSVLFYAGINSSEADIQKGKNEHFRVFAADLPSKTKAGAAAAPKIVELSRSGLFSSTDPEAYQRVLRISPQYTGSSQVGAVATGATGRAKDPQIAIFDIPPAGNNSPAPKLRGKVELVKEAMDLDVLQISDDEYQLAYCDDYDLYVMNISKADTTGPHSIFTMPHDESSGAKARPSFRAIRYLTPNFILAVANLPQAGGAVLQGFRLPKASDLGKGAEGEESKTKARLAISAHLPKNISRATGMAVRNLSPPIGPSTRQLDTQFTIAVTGQDSSIAVYTLEHQTSTVSDVNLITKLHPVTTLKAVHQGPISGIAFSHFTPPPKPITSTSDTPHRAPHLKLASIGSMANTLVVHSLPLRKLTFKTTSTPRGPPRPPRYVLGLKSHGPSPRELIIFSAIFFGMVALLLQGLLEVKGLARPVIGARGWTPARWHGPEYAYGSVPTAGVFDEFRERLKGALGKEGDGSKLVVLNAAPDGEGGGVKVEGLDEERHGEVRSWEEMHPAQKEAWKERLKKAGHWGEEMGEAVFKGVLFGEIAGVVGAMVR